MKPDWSTIRGHYEATGEPLRSVAKRFEIPFSTLGKRAVREQWAQPKHEFAQPSAEVDGNKIGNSEALFPSNNPLAAKNGSAGNDPAAKSGSKNGSNTELAAKNGSAWNDPAAKSGSKNGSSFDIPADINEWDSLTDQRFALITSRRVRRFVLWRSGSPCTSPRFSRKRHATNGSKPATLLPLEWKQMEASHSLLPFRLEADRKQMEAKQWLLPF